MDTVRQLRLQIARRLRCRPSSVQLHQGRHGRWHAIVQQHASDMHPNAQAALEDLLARVTEREGVAA